MFATAPGDEGYTPLRELGLVTWADDAEARLLTSAQEVAQAEAAGEIIFEQPGVVVNIPLLTWPGGQRSHQKATTAPCTSHTPCEAGAAWR